VFKKAVSTLTAYSRLVDLKEPRGEAHHITAHRGIRA